jgi:hypothetical protein
MADWEVWRQDDNGHRFLVAACDDRIQAIAQVMIFEAGHPHKQIYDIAGPRTPVVRTNRDLYLRLIALGEHLNRTGRALLDYMCALWTVSRPLAVYDELDGDLFAALLAAAASAPPVRPEPSWRVADFTVTDNYSGFADFTKVLCTQISDLLAFEENPPGPYASLGVDAPPRVDGGRATVDRWCNFDAATYLECAAAGSFGGWSVSDGRRVTVPGLPGDGPSDEVAALPRISWGDVGAFLEYGQCYE